MHLCGVLPEWLSVEQRASFAAAERTKRAFALASLPLPSLLDWRALERILPRADDGIVVCDGALSTTAAPRDLMALRNLLREGKGIVIRRAQLADPEMGELAQRFERAFARTVQVQLFVTPARTRGFSWHYDHEDVVILQTLGSKDYFLRENTLGYVAFERFREEVSPLQRCTLCAGDALYLPSGLWHMGKARDDAFSISLGLARAAQS